MVRERVRDQHCDGYQGADLRSEAMSRDMKAAAAVAEAIKI